MSTTTYLQQQVFALDARYNALRTTQSPNFRTVYIRRRNQLLKETERSSESWVQYLRLRSLLLQQRYGSQKMDTGSSTNISRKTSVSPESQNPVLSPKGMVVPTKEAEASRAIVGGNTIAENYAFSGVHHIFDQHSEAVTMVKFANNDRSRLCCSSLDGTLSLCDVASSPPSVVAILKGHKQAVPGFDWSANNDLIASASLDGTVRVWKTTDFRCLRILNEPNKSQILCCIFLPANNNLILTGNNRGELRVANVSTGIFLKHICRVGGSVLCFTSDTNGRIIWVGNTKGEIVSVFCEPNGGICKTKKIVIDPSCCVTSLSYRAWISREARDPLLLVNATNSSICLFSIIDSEGGLQLKRKFQNRHQSHIVKSTFCPIMSFRQGACVVTGSEDGGVYFVDVKHDGKKSVVNTLQGHSSTVLGISFNYDESLLATSDLDGLIILWKRSSNA